MSATRKVASIACHECGAAADLRITKKGRLYYHCSADGCGHQTFSRSVATDRRMAKRATAWTDTTMRAELGAGPKPPAADPPPVKPAEKPASIWDRPLFGG